MSAELFKTPSSRTVARERQFPSIDVRQCVSVTAPGSIGYASRRANIKVECKMNCKKSEMTFQCKCLTFQYQRISPKCLKKMYKKSRT